ncbi:MAG TPA: hypothetical protein ENI51_03205, partial [Candidatus Atribacteria bacterium]|nr:hypothetical protein [Candidatus Atribacteria bacterium]
AEILTGLTIDKWNEKVIDPACGSGTLLVSAYRRKFQLYEKEQDKGCLSSGEIEELHNLFTTEEITGIDIMPFATHLAAVNISAQYPQVTTNKVRITNQDSLFLQNLLQDVNFRKRGILLKPFSKIIQQTLIPDKRAKQKFISRDGRIVESKGTISAEGVGEEFLLRPCNVVIMNPPFSDREKLPPDYRKKLKDYKKLISKCGNQVNLWGFFLALADDLIEDNGKVGVVIPITFSKGKATEKIRNYYLKNYTVRYIIKPTKDIAFSEDATFRDILFIAEKKKPTSADFTKIVFLKKSLSDINLDSTREIVEKIRKNNPKGDTVYTDSDFEMYSIPAFDLSKQPDNMMFFISGGSIIFRQTIKNFLDLIERKSGNKTVIIKEEWLREGYGPRPKGTSDIVVVTRPIGKDRASRASLILKSEKKDKLLIQRKGTELVFDVEKQNAIRSLRSITNINHLDITSKEDFIITNGYSAFNQVRFFSKYEDKQFDWIKLRKELDRIGKTRTIFPDKIDLTSPNTHLLCVYSENKITPTNMFYLFNYPRSKEEGKIITLYMNSIVLISQFLINTSRLGGPYVRLKMENWKKIKVINPRVFSVREKQILLNLFKKIKKIEFPSIIDQLEYKFPARVELDRTILKILGLSDKEIDRWLPKVY